MKGKISLVSIFLYFLVKKGQKFRSFFAVTVTVTLFLGSYFVTQRVTSYSNAVTFNALLQCLSNQSIFKLPSFAIRLLHRILAEKDSLRPIKQLFSLIS